MATWKKVLVSGSAVDIASLTLDTQLAVAEGGTGATSFADKAVIITQDSGTDTLAAVAMSTNGQLLIGGTNGPAVAVPTGGDGLTVSVGDGSLEYDLDAALTTVTSVKNTSLVIGRDNDNLIKFGTDNNIIFEVGGGDNVIFKSSGVVEATTISSSANTTALNLIATGSGATQGNITATGTGSFTALEVTPSGDALTINNVGTVSGSLLSTGSFGHVEVGGNIFAGGLISRFGDADTGLEFSSDTVKIEGNNVIIGEFASTFINLNLAVTASKNISSSGTITGLNLVATGSGASQGTGSFAHVGVSGNIISTGGFVGALTGDVVGDITGDVTGTADEATVATNVTAVATTDNAEFFVGVLDGASGTQAVETVARFKYNPSSGKLSNTGDISSSATITGLNLVATGSAGNVTATGTGSFTALTVTPSGDALTIDNAGTVSGSLTSTGSFGLIQNATQFSVAQGGTGATSFADKAVIITQDTGTDTLAAVAMSTNGQLLIGGTNGPAVAVPTGGDGLTVTVGDGSLEYDLDAQLTTVTSILNTSLVIGRDSSDQIGFGTDNTIIFKAGNANQVTIKDGAFSPVTTNDVDFGTVALRFKDGHFSGNISASKFITDSTGSFGALTVEGAGDALTIDNVGTVSGSLIATASFGKFVGDGRHLSNVAAASVDIDGLDAFSGVPHATDDEFLISDDGTEKRATMTMVANGAFALVSGDATIAAGGALTVGTIGANHIDEISGLTDSEGAQLENINSVTITNTQWGYLGALDQAVNTNSNVQFGNAQIDGNLIVAGTASFQHSENLLVADRFISISSGSSTAGDGGIVVHQSAGDNPSGSAFGFEGGTANRWALQNDFTVTQSAMVPDAYVGVVTFSTAVPSGNPEYGGSDYGYGNIHVETDTGDIYMYS